MNRYLLPGSDASSAIELTKYKTMGFIHLELDADFSDCACSIPINKKPELRDAIAQTHNMEDLNELCFQLGINPQEVKGQTIKEKSRELVDYILRHKRESDLLTKLQSTRSRKQWDLYFACEESAENNSTAGLDFVNRSREIEYIMNPARSPIMLIDAPAGYGKSAILQELKERFEKENWRCKFVDLSKVQGDVDQKLRGTIRANHNKYIFLFDVAEQATDSDLEWLLKEFLPECKRNLPSAGFRVIFAGRYIESSTGASRWVGVEKMPLSPFSQQVVEQMIEQTLLNTSEELESTQIETLAKTVVELSGGHPRSIRNLIDNLARDKWIIPVTRLEKRELFKLCTAKEINQVTDKLGKETNDCLEGIFVFRRFNLKTLKFLQQRGEVEAKVDVFQILSGLTQKRLIARNNGSLFYSDRIVRDLILARLRLFEPDRYRELNQAAHELYKQWIESELNRPDLEDSVISSSDLVPILVMENIYHICQQFSPDVSTIEIAAKCIRENSSYLVRALGESPNDRNRQRHLKDLVLQDNNTCLIFEERGLNIDIVFEIAFDPSSAAKIIKTIRRHELSVELGKRDRIPNEFQEGVVKEDRITDKPKEAVGKGNKMTERHMYNWLIDTLDMLRHNAQNVLVERWENRNLGKAVTPPVFADRSISREDLAQTLPQADVLQRKLNSYQDTNGRTVLINEKYVTNLKKQMEMAQDTVNRYELSRNKPLSENEKIQLEAQIEEYQEKFDATARKLADIYAYIYSE